MRFNVGGGVLELLSRSALIDASCDCEFGRSGPNESQFIFWLLQGDFSVN